MIFGNSILNETNNIMRKFHFLFIALLLTIMTSLKTWAQCPGNVSVSTSGNIPANCPSSGSIRITANAPVGALSYVLITGPAGAPLNTAQDDSNFTALPAGAYQAKAYCKTDPSKADTIGFTILNNYTPLDSSVVITKAACSGDGMIRVAAVIGGKPPFQYALSTQAAYPGGLSAFQNVDSFSNLAAGMYMIRIKDGCGQYLNKQVEVLPPLPAPQVWLGILNDQPCANNTWSLYAAGATNPATGGSIDLTPYFQNQNGLILNIYEITGNCQKGTLLTTYDPVTAGNPHFAAPKRTEYWVEAVTSCGQTYGYCTSAATSGQIQPPSASLLTSSKGCGTSSSPATMSIVAVYPWLVRWEDGITVTVKNSANAEITGSPFKFHSAEEMNNALKDLPHDSYSITAVDTCGTTVIDKTVQDITLAGSATASILSYYMDCITQTNTTDVSIQMEGYIPNLGNADSVSILSGPSNVGVTGYTDDKAEGIYTWANMLTGSYWLRVYTSCGTTDLPVTLSATGMKRFISAKATSFCTGGGKVAIDSIIYTGDGVTEYVLINTSGNIRVDSNITGTFTNLPTGDYKIALKIAGYCNYQAGWSYEVYSNTASIVQGGSTPRIVKKMAVTCEDVAGNLLPNGTIYLSLAGPAPLTLEYIDSSATTPAWVTVTTSAAASETISGLNAGHLYYIRLSGCTGGVSEPVTFGQMTPIQLSNTAQPCANSPYTLSIPEMPGAAYEWRNPVNTVVSTSPTYDIINYNASYDGTYTCKVTFSSCITRTVTVTLNSQICGMPLPVHLTSFRAANKDCKPELSWSAVYQMTDKEFVIERSDNGQNFTAIATVPVEKQANAQYNYTDITADISTRNIYYRIRLVDLNESYIYSPIVMVKSCDYKGNTGNLLFSVLPNPALNGQGFNLSYKGNATSGTCLVLNTAGQIVMTRAVALSNGASIYIPLQKVTPGVYIVVLNEAGNNVSGREKLVIY